MSRIGKYVMEIQEEEELTYEINNEPHFEYPETQQEPDTETLAFKQTENIMGFNASNSGLSFEMVPEGVHIARCYKMIDIGTQNSEFQGVKSKKHKIIIAWELLGDEKMEDGRPYSQQQRYTLSLHENAALRKDLQAWRGKAFSPEEEANFDVSKVLGTYCMLNIVHTSDNGKDYSNISSIMPIPKGMPKPDGVNKLQIFDIDNPDMELFETFGEKLKATIMSAPEWSNKQQENQSGDFTGLDDDIPF